MVAIMRRRRRVHGFRLKLRVRRLPKRRAEGRQPIGLGTRFVVDLEMELNRRYAAAQERTARLVQTVVDDLRAAGEGQMEAAKALLTPPPWATGAAATEPFTQMMQAWTDAFTRFSRGPSADPRSS